MNATPKTRLCWNCEGRVSPVEPNCAYCGVYLGVEEGAIEETKSKDPFDPPYNPEEQSEETIPESPYAVESEQEEELQPVQSNKEVLLTTALLSSGVLFFLFGFVLYAFGEGGSLTLRWDSNYWYVYLLGALPLFFFGWRQLGILDQD